MIWGLYSIGIPIWSLSLYQLIIILFTIFFGFHRDKKLSYVNFIFTGNHVSPVHSCMILTQWSSVYWKGHVRSSILNWDHIFITVSIIHPIGTNETLIQSESCWHPCLPRSHWSPGCPPPPPPLPPCRRFGSSFCSWTRTQTPGLWFMFCFLLKIRNVCWMDTFLGPDVARFLAESPSNSRLLPPVTSSTLAKNI